jgi:hypothetical protein
MGNSLCVISNHSIKFEEPQDIIASTVQRLNEFNWQWRLLYDMVKDLNHKRYLITDPNPKWAALPYWLPTSDNEYDTGTWENGTGYLEFQLGEKDCFGLSLHRHAADFNINVGMSSYHIFRFIKKSKDSKTYFDNERRIYQQLCYALGGDRVIYVGDQITAHAPVFDMMWDNTTTFESIEKHLLTTIGKPVENMTDIYDDEEEHHNRYFIDTFNDLINPKAF